MAPIEPQSRFHSTRWSVVAAAVGSSEDSRKALAELCRDYWYPLYAYVRRCGESAEDAQDTVQAFFTELLDKDFLRAADEDRGRFRSFLLMALKRFRAKEYAKQRAQKRGGGAAILSLDFDRGEQRYAQEPAAGDTPEAIYARRWALTVLERALDCLRAAADAAGETERFEQLKQYLAGDSGESYATTAERLGMSANAVKAAVFRLRSKFREAIREQIAGTVAAGADLEDELRDLQTALGKPAS